MRSVSCEGHDVVFAPAAGDHAGSHRLRIEEVWMGIDRFGNPFAPNLSYARGEILPSTAHDFKKLQHAWAMIRERGPESIFIFTGLEHSMPMQAEDLRFADDEIGPALHFERLKELALDHLGGSPEMHDVAVFNRLTGATMATHLTLVEPGDVVIGVSASHSHPSVLRAADHTGARFTDTTGLAAFKDVIAGQSKVTLVVLTRLAVTYELLPLDAIRQVVRIAHDKGALVYIDDAGGARVGPAAFDQPRMLELGVDVGATGLDKYGTIGPRFGLLAGRQDLVDRIRAKGFEFGMEARPALYPAVVHTIEQYDPRRIRVLIDSTMSIGKELRPLLGNRLRETPTTVQLAADDILEIAMERGGVDQPTIVPYEATAALSMLMLKDYNMLMVHFVGVPPGGADLLIKFVPPETLSRFGGPKKYAEAVNGCLTKLGNMLREPESIRGLLLGSDAVH
jgi:L-seryl-tRNA(Ser) seleniumtransferase